MMLVEIGRVRGLLLVMAVAGRGTWLRIGHLVTGKVNRWRVIGREPRVWIKVFVGPQAVGVGLVGGGQVSLMMGLV